MESRRGRDSSDGRGLRFAGTTQSPSQAPIVSVGSAD